MRRTHSWWLMLAWAAVGCRALDLPPPPGAGSIQGTLIFTKPGGESVPAGAATIELLGTSLVATSDPESGYFSLSPVPAATGTLLIRYDADHDGTFDHNRAISLESIKAGPGLTVALGQVVLAGNASIRGAVLRADALASGSGHGGTNVFTPAGPYLVNTGDNGAFSLEGLPEGDVSLAFFREGYVTQQTTLSLRAGETYSVPTIVLTRDTSPNVPVHVSGSATLYGQTSAPDIVVSASNGTHTLTAADGTWSLDLPAGLYVFGFQKEGFATVTLRNIAVTGVNFQVPSVILAPGTSTLPVLDAGVVPYDAGVVIDAGLVIDAGIDAGLVIDAGIDAGLVIDAGIDAGLVIDAGIDAGLVIDAGTDAGLVIDAGLDAGLVIDAGSPPLAVIDALPLYRAPSSGNITLSGVHSTGGTPPYTYHWAQTRGTPVTLSANHSITAATPVFSAPSAATMLGFSLSIVDAFDAGSVASPEVTMAIGTPPTAVIDGGYPTTVFASQVVQLDGTPSVDTSGTGVISYLWTVAPAGVVTMGPANQAKVQLTMPSIVNTPQALTVTLRVVNGLGISSNPLSVTIALSNATVPPWYADAGPGQTVNGGDIVTLKGAAVGALPGATFTYQWSPAGESGGTAWALQDPLAPTTTFVAPIIAGPNKLVTLTFTATSTSGLTPAQSSAFTFVNIVDKTPPVVVGTSITPQGRAGTMGVSVDFSEPIDPSTINSININGASVTERQLSNGNTRVGLITAPMVDGNSYTLTVGGVRDVSSQPNTCASTQYPFVAQAMTSPAYESTATSTANPRPGLVLRAAATPGYEALVFARNGNAPWFFDAVDPYACAATPCTLATDTTVTAPTLTAALQRAPRGFRLGNTAYATLQPRDYATSTPPAVWVRTANTWAVMPTPPGNFVTDGVKLYSSYIENGLKLATFDTIKGDWDLPNASVVSSDLSLYSSDSASAPLAQGAWPIAPATSYAYVSSKVSKSNSVYSYQLTTLPPTSGSTWVQYGPWANVVEHRMYTVGNNGLLAHTLANGSLNIALFGWANNFFTPFSSGVTAFDGMLRGGLLYVVAAYNGQIVMRYLSNGTWYVIPGVFGESFNNSPTCTADTPEVSFINDKIGITWAEQCSGGPWHVYFRILN